MRYTNSMLAVLLDWCLCIFRSLSSLTASWWGLRRRRHFCKISLLSDIIVTCSLRLTADGHFGSAICHLHLHLAYLFWAQNWITVLLALTQWHSLIVQGLLRWYSITFYLSAESCLLFNWKQSSRSQYQLLHHPAQLKINKRYRQKSIKNYKIIFLKINKNGLLPIGSSHPSHNINSHEQSRAENQ